VRVHLFSRVCACACVRARDVKNVMKRKRQRNGNLRSKFIVFIIKQCFAYSQRVNIDSLVIFSSLAWLHFLPRCFQFLVQITHAQVA
jgi:hypothetical protein